MKTNLPELSYSSQGFVLTLAEDDLRDTHTEMNDRLISAQNLTAEQIQQLIKGKTISPEYELPVFSLYPGERFGKL